MERKNVRPAPPVATDLDLPESVGRRRVVALFETPDRLLEAIVAAEVLGLPLALRTTSTDRRTF